MAGPGLSSASRSNRLPNSFTAHGYDRYAGDVVVPAEPSRHRRTGSPPRERVSRGAASSRTRNRPGVARRVRHEWEPVEPHQSPRAVPQNRTGPPSPSPPPRIRRGRRVGSHAARRVIDSGDRLRRCCTTSMRFVSESGPVDTTAADDVLARRVCARADLGGRAPGSGPGRHANAREVGAERRLYLPAPCALECPAGTRRHAVHCKSCSGAGAPTGRASSRERAAAIDRVTAALPTRRCRASTTAAGDRASRAGTGPSPADGLTSLRFGYRPYPLSVVRITVALPRRSTARCPVSTLTSGFRRV
jgi:hypothetical protein